MCWFYMLLCSVGAGSYFGVDVGAGLIGICHNPVAGSLHLWMMGWCVLIMLAYFPLEIVTLSVINTVT